MPMMWGWNWGWQGWLFGGLMMLVFWGGLIWLVVWAVRTTGGGSRRDEPERRHHHALDVLAERFARGEISEEEFEQRKRVLERPAS